MRSAAIEQIQLNDIATCGRAQRGRNHYCGLWNWSRNLGNGRSETRPCGIHQPPHGRSIPLFARPEKCFCDGRMTEFLHLWIVPTPSAAVPLAVGTDYWLTRIGQYVVSDLLHKELVHILCTLKTRAPKTIPSHIAEPNNTPVHKPLSYPWGKNPLWGCLPTLRFFRKLFRKEANKKFLIVLLMIYY